METEKSKRRRVGALGCQSLDGCVEIFFELDKEQTGKTLEQHLAEQYCKEFSNRQQQLLSYTYIIMCNAWCMQSVASGKGSPLVLDTCMHDTQ